MVTGKALLGLFLLAPGLDPGEALIGTFGGLGLCSCPGTYSGLLLMAPGEALLVDLLLLVDGLDLDESLLEFGLVTCNCMGFVSAVSWMDFYAALSFY